jgi:glycosyltransferase involved in cell wall biosynthesis
MARAARIFAPWGCRPNASVSGAGASSTRCSVRRDPAWRRGLGYADEDVVLLFFGRLVREKGTACFVETVRELRRRGLAVRPLIVGDGPARAEMEAQVGEAAFLGHLDGEDLGRAIANADILLNPSLTEAFGNVNLEAMAAGVCVVTANVGSSSAIITHGKDGYLIEPDPIAFADAIHKLAGDRVTRRRVGQNATATAESYQWSEVLDDVVRTYRDLSPT